MYKLYEEKRGFNRYQYSDDYGFTCSICGWTRHGARKRLGKLHGWTRGTTVVFVTKH
jgi:hypothetical protein